ncbi:LppX_LprAFG lipoprotein [Motilibacter aurantiacus]|uniref:LppX_LprAFG lipoprotein n=1 Tax=Motilibacter aurantiacus TaxID=2714955 RepID=UPI0014094659|nr:LppX_LprAFG lipoprotein [Motilibacter aurantiacus]NHC47205.1 LppX_LprAFG lipoprotein [Motilibacter aurantiacus]
MAKARPPGHGNCHWLVEETMHRAIPATALAAALAFGLSACGGSSDEGAAPAPAGSVAASASPSGPTASGDFAQVLADSQRATLAAGTARIEMQAGVGLAGQAQDVSATGAFDFAAERGSMTVTTGLGGQSVSVKTIVAKDAVYVQNPASPGQWIKQEVPQGLGGLASGNPAAALGVLTSATSDVVLAGEEDVRGDRTDHYTGTIDPAALAQSLPQAQQDQLAALGDAWPFEAWIDDEGRLRKLTMSAGGAGSSAGDATSAPKPAPTGDAGQMSLTLTIEMYDFGTPVTVQTPAPGSVREAPGLGSGLGGGSDAAEPAATAGA